MDVADWTKEPCLSCKVSNAEIHNVSQLKEALLKCKGCTKKEAQK